MTLSRCGGSLRWRTFPLCGLFALAVTGCHVGSPGSGGAGASATSINNSSSSASAATTSSVSSGSTGGSPSATSISGAPPTQAAVNQSYSFTPTVLSSGGTVSFSIQNKPSWASFSIATGRLTGTPTSADVGSYANIMISVSNGTSTASLSPFTITVTAGSSGTATLSWIAPVINTNGTAITNLAGYEIEYGATASSLSQNITIANPSATSYTVQNLSSGTWYFGVVAYTTSGSQSSLSNIVSKTIP